MMMEKEEKGESAIGKFFLTREMLHKNVEIKGKRNIKIQQTQGKSNHQISL